MSNTFAVYQSNQVALIAADIPILDGRADPFVKIEKDNDSYETVEGVDGHVCRCATNSRLWTVTVSLLGSSKENAKLSALHAIDTNTPGGSGVGAFLLKDLNGSSILAGAQCWIQKPPGGEFGKQRGNVDWIFKVVADPATMILGGNG